MRTKKGVKQGKDKETLGVRGKNSVPRDSGEGIKITRDIGKKCRSGSGQEDCHGLTCRSMEQKSGEGRLVARSGGGLVQQVFGLS